MRFHSHNIKNFPHISIGEKEYYERQFATLKSFEEVDSVVASDGIEEEDLEEQYQQERAMRISNYANILLLAFKVTYHWSKFTFTTSRILLNDVFR